MTFTPKTPTESGIYAWKENATASETLKRALRSSATSGKILVHHRGYIMDPSRVGGLWCRLMPADDVVLKSEVEKAYSEGWTDGFACDSQAIYRFDDQHDMDFNNSRAKQVVKGWK